MAILFVLPSFASLECEVPLEIRIALDRFPLFPGKPEVDVLELVVKADLARVRKTRPEIHLVDARPVNGTHAHRTGGAVHVELAALEHLRPLGRAFGPRNQPEIPLVVIRAQQGLGVDAAAGVNDSGHFSVIDWYAGQQNAVLAAADDVAILDDDCSERSAPSLFDGFNGETGRLVQELLFIFVALDVWGAHVGISVCWLLVSGFRAVFGRDRTHSFGEGYGVHLHRTDRGLSNRLNLEC